MRILRLLWNGQYGGAYLLLALATLFWGGNAVAGRLAIGEVSPMALTMLRWAIVFTVLAPFVGRAFIENLALLRKHARTLLLLALAGFTGFNALFYTAAYYTSAINLTLFQGSIPVMVLLGSILFLGARARAIQIAGVAVTLAGVAIVSIKGDLSVLLSLDVNYGDMLILLASALYAGYTVGLKRKPAMPSFVFFAGLAIAALITSAPLAGIEYARSELQWPTLKGWAILLYIGLFPSLASQVLFIRGVELLGPARAGIFTNLIPVFGALLGVAILGEAFAFYHAIGLFLVLGGIWLAERRA